MAIATKILIVDDDPAIRNLIFRFLGQKNYQMESAQDGKSALEVFDRFSPDLVVLDLNLPDINGYNLCEEMRKRKGNVFILMLTSLSDPTNIIKGFQGGTDDYLTKPFDLQVLECRVEALLKRQRTVAPTVPQQPLIFEELTIDPIRREVKVSGEVVALTTLEFDLLYFLAGSPGRAWHRSELLEKVWDYDYVGDQRVVDVHIGQIRKKIEVDASKPSWIQTVRGIGYKFDPPSPIIE
jgi:DNA-binding response OmpR family regulator